VLRCFIVGDRPGEYSRQLAELVSQLPPELLGRVHVVAETRPVTIYWQAADLFVCTSRVESYPRVTLEAMDAALPIISTPVFGLAEQLRDGVNASFYEPGDVAALAAALTRLVRDPTLRLRMGQNSALVLDGLTSFDEMLDTYEQLLVEAAAAR
jgi:glycosyltransferase involved in cell wall biosynthesis